MRISCRYAVIGNHVDYHYNGIFIGSSYVMSNGKLWKSPTLIKFLETTYMSPQFQPAY